MPNPWTHALPPNTRAPYLGDPANDADAFVDALTAIGAGFNVLNPVFAGGADPSGSSDSTAAFRQAAAAFGPNGIVIVPPGTYKISGSGGDITTTTAGARFWGFAGASATRVNYLGSGAAFRMYTTAPYSPGGPIGGGIEGIYVDISGAGAGAAGIHFGDIYQPYFHDFRVRGGGLIPGGINFWFDNNYWWSEQIRGDIWSEQGPVVFDNSANLGGNATGSFDRCALTIWADNKGKSDLLVFQNGAFNINPGPGFGLYGNTDYGSSLFYTVKITGSNAFAYTATNASPCVFTGTGSYFSNGTLVFLSGGSPPGGFVNGGTGYYVVNASLASGGTQAFQLASSPGGAAINSTTTGNGNVQGPYSRIADGPFGIGVECNGTSGTQPGTIFLGSPGFTKNTIIGTTGVWDWSGNNAFAHGSTALQSLLHEGPVYGDNSIIRSDKLGQARYANGALAAGGTIVTRGVGQSVLAPAGGVTGMILQTPVIPQASVSQRVTVLNNSAFTVTFAASGTSNVADGAADVIAANSGATFEWSTDASLWFRV